MTLMLSANGMGFVKVFIVGGMSFMYLMIMKGSRIDSCVTPWFIVFWCKKNYSDCFKVILLWPFVFC